MAGIASCGGPGGVKCATGPGWAACAKLYKQARLCPSVGALQDVWMTTANAAMFPNAFYLSSTGLCYYFDATDVPSATPGTIYAAALAVAQDDCTSCGCPCTFPPGESPATVTLDFDVDVIEYSSMDGSCTGFVAQCTKEHHTLTLSSDGDCTWDDNVTLEIGLCLGGNSTFIEGFFLAGFFGSWTLFLGPNSSVLFSSGVYGTYSNVSTYCIPGGTFATPTDASVMVYNIVVSP